MNLLEYIDNVYNENDIIIDILRLDLLHPLLQGNKFYKLKYNLAKATEKHLPIVTIGGAFSNHIHATAQACKLLNIPCYGIIRGEHFKVRSNTLQFVEEHNMTLIYLNREDYDTLRHLNETDKQLNEKIRALIKQIPKDFYFIPEGGSNKLGVKGAEEILKEVPIQNYNHIYCPIGSGGTISGIINSVKNQISITGIACVKDDSLKETITKLTENRYTNWSINYDFTFGGFAKHNKELVQFINTFSTEKNIPLDPIYTGKMLFGLNQLLKKNLLGENNKILAIHTGGLQGIKGFNQMNKLKLIC